MPDPGLGITRLADLTGLDPIGLPVWASYRPNARSLSVCQGKGLSNEHARLTAVMEAIETALAEDAERLLPVGATTEQMRAAGRSVVPFELMLKCCDPSLAAKRELRWVKGQSFATGDAIWAPFELVGLDWRKSAGWNGDAFQQTSVGLAAHFDKEAAILNGLLEAIEYDAVGLAFAWPGILERSPALDPEQCKGPGFKLAMERVLDAGFAASFLDITTDIGLPTVFCALDGPSPTHDRGRLAPFVGHACRLDGEDAMLAALLEAVQSQATDISGARDDIKYSDYALAPMGDLRSNRSRRDYGALPSSGQLTTLPVRRQIEFIRSRLAACGLDDVYVFDLRGEEYGVACVAVLCPGLEIGGRHEGCRTGHRARMRIIQHALSQS